jgi:hypothetical protein
MERFAEDNVNFLHLDGQYDPATQTWRQTENVPTMRTNYQTWQRTQMTTSTHTANGDYVPDFPDDTQPDNASD